MKALDFWLAVEAGKLKQSDLDTESLTRITGITTAISNLLDARPST